MLFNNLNALALVASLAAPADAFWRMTCPGRLVKERADPIVAPGKVSAHVHTISGGSGFGFEMTYDQARASKCSSCPIKADLSNYWTPSLYFKAQNGSFISVPQAGDFNGQTGGMTVYYQQRPGPNNDKLKAFPKGFRMVAGDPFKRAPGTDFASKAVSFACLDYNGPATAETNNFPNRNCPNGLRAQIYFPSCWDGKNLDSPDHKSHMSYPASGNYNGGPCPASHPVHLISIFYEVIYDTQKFANEWYGSSQPFVFAQGDPTGYGMHGDFVNGWDVDVLQRATDQCTANSGSIKDCPVFANDLFTNDQCHACKIAPSVNEQVDGVMAKLPGCNPVTPGPARAAPVTTCQDSAVIGAAATYFTDVTASKKWEYVGCGTDKYNDRTFRAKSTNQATMTVEKCIDYCSTAGYSYAGLEYGTECYCDNTLRSDRAPVPGVMGSCTMKCGGNGNQYCGGGSAMSIYHKCGSTCKNAAMKKRHLDEYRHAPAHGQNA